MMFSADDLNFQLDNDLGTRNLPKSPSVTSHSVFRLPVVSKIDLLKKTNSNPENQDIQSNGGYAGAKSVQRKFPGPAGLLPDKPPRSFNDSSFTLEQAEDNVNELCDPPILYSQTSEDIFSEPPFKKLKNDLNMNTPTSPLNSYTVGWVKKKTSTKGLLGRKIPFLAVVIQTVDCSTADPVVTLRDQTGELSGILHRQVWKDMGDKLRTGAAMVLKQVGVLSTGVSRRQVILNITMNNIVTVYSPSDNGEVTIKTVHPTSSTDLAKSIVEWQAQMNAPSPFIEPMKTVFSSPINRQGLFDDVTSSRRGVPSSSTPIRPALFIRPRADAAEKKKQEKDSLPVASFENLVSDFTLCDSDFEEIDTLSTKENCVTEKNPQLDTITSDERSSDKLSFKSTFRPRVPTLKETNTNGANENVQIIRTNMVLSQAESIMLDEVLDGIELDDF